MMAAPASKSNIPKRNRMVATARASRKRMAVARESYSHLPEEILECIFKSIRGRGKQRALMSLSLVSKQFLSITNRIRFSLNITSKIIPFVSRFLHRFPNLTSLDLYINHPEREQVDALLTLISTFPLDLKSLNLCPLHSWSVVPIPAKGLKALSKTMKNLKTLRFYKTYHFDKTNLFFIADCFPLLEELSLSDPSVMIDDNDPLLALPNLRQVNLFGRLISDQFIDFLRRSCKLLRVVLLRNRHDKSEVI